MQVSDKHGVAALHQQQNHQTKETAKPALPARSSHSVNQPGSGSFERETFEIPLLKNMSDEEYQAFLRATDGMSETQTVQAAEGLNLIAGTYEESQRIINGGLLQALSHEEPASLLSDLSQGDLRSAINQGADLLGRLTQSDQVRLVQLIERMAMALTQKGLNLHG